MAARPAQRHHDDDRMRGTRCLVAGVHLPEHHHVRRADGAGRRLPADRYSAYPQRYCSAECWRSTPSPPHRRDGERRRRSPSTTSPMTRQSRWRSTTAPATPGADHNPVPWRSTSTSIPTGSASPIPDRPVQTHCPATKGMRVSNFAVLARRLSELLGLTDRTRSGELRRSPGRRRRDAGSGATGRMLLLGTGAAASPRHRWGRSRKLQRRQLHAWTDPTRTGRLRGGHRRPRGQRLGRRSRPDGRRRVAVPPLLDHIPAPGRRGKPGRGPGQTLSRPR